MRSLRWFLCALGAMSLALVQSCARPSAAAPAPAADPPARLADLMVGDPAPPLSIERWIKGGPVARFEKGRVYMVEFWATWCGPCVAAMPHLSKLQQEYAGRGVTIISVTGPGCNEEPEAVERFLAARGGEIGYTLAWDQGSRTFDPWMRAAQMPGIPTAFIVNQDGIVAAIGYPGWMDEPLKQIVAGTHDLRAATENYRQSREAAEHSRLVQEQAGRLVERAATEDAAERARALRELRELIDGEASKELGVLLTVANQLVHATPRHGMEELDMALAAAEQAQGPTAGRDAYCLDALAAVWYARGDVQKAIECEGKAVEYALPELKPAFAATLGAYEKALRGRE